MHKLLILLFAPILLGATFRSSIILPSAVEDADGDTKIELEKTPNENKMRYTIAGVERVIFDALHFQFLGTPPGSIGGFQSGLFHATNLSAIQFSNSVITGHNLFNGNTQLWYFGSASSSNDNIVLINRQNGSLGFFTNNLLALLIEAGGNSIFEKQIQIKGGVPGLNKVLTSDAVGLATWETPAGGGWTDDGPDVRLTTSTDRVGIGIAVALEKLHVESGDILIGDLSADRSLRIANTAGTNINRVLKREVTTQDVFVGDIDANNAKAHLVANGLTGITVKEDGDLIFVAYPNTRDDGVPLNILGTDATGNLVSGLNQVIHIGGNFTDTVDQTIVTADIPQVITFNQNRLIDDVSHTVGSAVFTINTAGVYNFIVAPQLAQGSGSAMVEFWIRKNGTDIVDSNVQETISANSQSLPLLRWKERFVATDTIEIVWASNSANTLLDNIASLFTGPNIPSIMLDITYVGF